MSSTFWRSGTWMISTMFSPLSPAASVELGPMGRICPKSLSRTPVNEARSPAWLKNSRWPQDQPAGKASRVLSMTVALVPSRVATIVSTAGSPS